MLSAGDSALMSGTAGVAGLLASAVADGGASGGVSQDARRTSAMTDRRTGRVTDDFMGRIIFNRIDRYTGEPPGSGGQMHRVHGMRATIFIMILALGNSVATGDAQQGTESSVESDLPEILVVGRVPRCRPLPGDPLDSVDLAAAASQSKQQVIKSDPMTGIMAVLPDDDPMTGPGIWQRAGTRMDQYVFRVPRDGTPLCIGTRNERAPGWAQLRQVVDAKPYHGKTVRVTLWAASRDAGRVWFWVASGREENQWPKAPRRADMAAESGSFEFRGTRRWTPVSLTMGPIRCDQEKMSFGALLEGRGDLWIYRPELQVIAELADGDKERECRALRTRRFGAGP
jgi:hypothetical protein